MTQPDPTVQSGGAEPQSGLAGQTGTTPPVPAPPADPATQSGQQTPATVAQAEYEALLRRMQASDSNNSKLQAQLKAHEDAKLTEAERTANALKEAQAALAEKDARIADLQLEAAFLGDNTYTWHDPSLVMQALDRTKVEMKDGKPTNIKALLDEIAKARPFLVKPAETPTPPAPGGPTGLPMNNGTTTKVPSTTQTDLERRFPALRGRVPKGS